MRSGSAVEARAEEPSVGNSPYAARAWGTGSVNGPFVEIPIERRALGPNDVLLDILYAGICHSEIHTVRGDWGAPKFPCVPGHEVFGRVLAIGSAVTKFRVGDIGGVS